MSNITRKTINFDFSTKALEENMQEGEKYNKAYAAIERYLEKAGFEHTQESAYTSIKPIKHREVLNLVSDLSNKFPYMEGAFKSCETTSVSKTYDVTELMKDNHSLELLEPKNLHILSSYNIKPNTSQSHRKSIRFDYSQEALDENLSKYSTDKLSVSTAYNITRNYFEKLGYTHEQGSVYLSSNEKTDLEVLKDIFKFAEGRDFLVQSLKSMQISNAGIKYDITDLANGTSVDRKVKKNIEIQDEKENNKQIDFKIKNHNELSFD